MGFVLYEIDKLEKKIEEKNIETNKDEIDLLFKLFNCNKYYKNINVKSSNKKNRGKEQTIIKFGFLQKILIVNFIKNEFLL